MAVLSAPTNIPTLDGTTAVCVSDDATGTVYLSVRTDRAWYSVANGDSQANADADKAVIIAGTTDSNIVFADNQAASLDPEQLIDGLPERLDPANPYYGGWVQQPEADSGITTLFYSTVAPYSFGRSDTDATASGPDSAGTIVEVAAGQPVHPGADWSGSAWSNTSGLSRGVICEPERTQRWFKAANMLEADYAGTATLTQGQVGPMGGTEALHIDMSADSTSRAYCGTPLTRRIDNTTYTFSMWIKGDTAGVYPLAVKTKNGSDIPFSPTVTTSWGRYSVTYFCGTGTNELDYIGNRRDGEAGATCVAATVWNPQDEPGAFATTDILNTTAAVVTRPATTCVATMTDLGLPSDIDNDVSGQIKVRPQFAPSDDRLAETTIMQLYGDADNHITLAWAQNTDVISLTKTVATVEHTATYAPADINYTRNQSLTIDWEVTTAGMSLQVVGFAPKIHSNTDPLVTAIASSYLGQSQGGSQSCQVVELCTIGPSA